MRMVGYADPTSDVLPTHKQDNDGINSGGRQIYIDNLGAMMGFFSDDHQYADWALVR